MRALKILWILSLLIIVPAFGICGTVNLYTSDFSAGDDGWTDNQGDAPAGNIDGISEEDNCLRLIISNGLESSHFLYNDIFSTFLVIGKKYRVRFDYYIPAGQSNVDGIQLWNYATGSNPVTDLLVETGSWVSVDFAFIAQEIHLRLYAYDGAAAGFRDLGDDDAFYIRNFICDKFLSGAAWW